MSAAPGFDLRPLFDKANARAELILSVVRLVIGAALFTFLLATLPNPLRIFLGGPDEVLWRGNLIGQDIHDRYAPTRCSTRPTPPSTA